MRPLRLVFAVLAFSLVNTTEATAMYLLDGERSTVGAYAYDVAPDGEASATEGQSGRQFLRFQDGALMDRSDAGELGRSVAYPATGGAGAERFLFLDLGQEVLLEQLTVRSRLAPHSKVGVFQASFSTTGESFGDTFSDLDTVQVAFPHDPDLDVIREVPVDGRAARYIRLRFFAAPWNAVQIGEIDIVARTSPDVLPATDVDLGEFMEVVAKHTDTPLIDEFGQWTRSDWPGKVHSEGELIARHREDQARYAESRLDPDRFDRFGGDMTLGIQRDTGDKFRVEKVDGRWWFITPDGFPFVMIAMDGINLYDQGLMDAVAHPSNPDLAARFEWLPDEADETYADCWTEPEPGVKRFDRYRANLTRVYGKDACLDEYHKLARRRLWAWGFNSIGKWSGESPAAQRRLDMYMPYILVLSDGAKDIPRYADFADPWHPDFKGAVDAALRRALEEYGCADDPYYMGFTVGNEGWWNDTFTEILLESVPPRPIKRRLVAQLEERHGGIHAVNQLCGASWGSFEELLELDLNPYAEALKEDMSQLMRDSSDRFYGAWREARDKHDPGRILFGSSFVVFDWWHVTREWAEGSIRHCDTLMLDWYGQDPARVLEEYVEAFGVRYDKPVLNAEQGFSTIRFGFRPTFNLNADDDGRGRWYRYSWENLYAHPNWLGTMYFIYRDFTLYGYGLDGSGEAAQHGVVNVCDLPYNDYIEHITRTNKRLVDIHAGKVAPVTKAELGLE